MSKEELNLFFPTLFMPKEKKRKDVCGCKKLFSRERRRRRE
jgi:hypothetical protein